MGKGINMDPPLMSQPWLRPWLRGLCKRLEAWGTLHKMIVEIELYFGSQVMGVSGWEAGQECIFHFISYNET